MHGAQNKIEESPGFIVFTPLYSWINIERKKGFTAIDIGNMYS